jgi:hypothetical protein
MSAHRGRRLIQHEPGSGVGAPFNDYQRRTRGQPCRIRLQEWTIRSVNHNLRHDEPLIYETLIIGGGYDATGMRYATEKQAREGHRRAVDELRAGRGPRAASPLAPPAGAHITPTHEGRMPRSAVGADGSSHGRHRRAAPDD